MKRDCIYQVLTVLLTCLFVLGSAADIYASAVNGYEQDTEALYGVIDSGEEGYGITGDESVTDSLQEADESELELPDASLSSTEDLSNGNDSEPSEAQDTSASESDLSGDLSETDLTGTDESTACPTDSGVDTDSRMDESIKDLTTAEEAIRETKLSGGLYYIHTCEASSTMICVNHNSKDDAANVQLGTFVNSNVRIFEVSETGDGYYNIRNFLPANT